MTGQIIGKVVISAYGTATAQPTKGTIVGKVIVRAVGSVVITKVATSGSLNRVVPIKITASGSTPAILDPVILRTISAIELPFRVVIVGKHGKDYQGSITAKVIIRPTITGHQKIAGIVGGRIIIRPVITATTSATSAIYSKVVIRCQAYAVNRPQTGTISRLIKINISATGLAAAQYGQAATTVRMIVNARGRAINFGFIGPYGGLNTTPMIVPLRASPSNRARSYLPNGEPTPQAFRHGRISASIVISSDFSNTVNFYAEGKSVVTIRANARGRVLAFSGKINAPIIISAYLADKTYGLSVAKINSHAVTYGVAHGITIPKAYAGVVMIEQPSIMKITKVVAYAVLAPAIAQEDIDYRAILFF